MYLGAWVQEYRDRCRRVNVLNHVDYKDRLLVGDAYEHLKALPSDVIDTGVTSPPYNKQEKNKGWLVKNVVYNGFRDRLPEAQYQSQQVRVLDEIYRVTKPGGSFFYNHKIRWDKGNMYHPMDWLRRTKWSVRQEIIWHRVIAGNIRGWRFWQVDERIYWLYKPINGNKIGKELLSKDAKCTSVWRGMPESKNPHPAPFPLWLPARIILATLRESEGLVLDPYVGSGTTAVAAKLLGAHYLGIDISEDYINHAKQRVREYETEKSHITKELNQRTVLRTFDERKRQNKKGIQFSLDGLPL